MTCKRLRCGNYFHRGVSDDETIQATTERFRSMLVVRLATWPTKEVLASGQYRDRSIGGRSRPE
jgi:hypothetical protein